MPGEEKAGAGRAIVIAWLVTAIYYFYQYVMRSAPAVMMPELSQGPLKGLFVAMKSSLDVATAKPKFPKFFEIYDELSGLSQEIGLGKVSPEDGAKRGQDIMVKYCGQKCLP